MTHAEKLGSRFERWLSMEEITTEEVTERLSSRLRRMVGPGRRWSYAGVSARTGIDVRTLKAYANGTACPGLARYKRLLAVLGPELSADLNLMQGWLPRSGETPPEAVDLVQLREVLLDASRKLAAILADEAESRGKDG